MPVSYAKLFDLMSQKGIKKVDLRKTYKLNPKTVDSLVNNRSVTVDTIMQLCEILDCQPGDLMEYVKEEKQPYNKMLFLCKPSCRYKTNNSSYHITLF